MIILDTNVISEPTKLIADDRLLVWLDNQLREDMYITAITVAEVMQGLALLPDGSRKRSLGNEIEKMIRGYIINPTLPFGDAAAVASGEIVVRAKKNLYTLGSNDLQIAAIAFVHDATIATRDVDPFLAAGIPVINPWTAPVS